MTLYNAATNYMYTCFSVTKYCISSEPDLDLLDVSKGFPQYSSKVAEPGRMPKPLISKYYKWPQDRPNGIQKPVPRRKRGDYAFTMPNNGS